MNKRTRTPAFGAYPLPHSFPSPAVPPLKQASRLQASPTRLYVFCIERGVPRRYSWKRASHHQAPHHFGFKLESWYMTQVTISHFEQAAVDIGSNGDNDTLPFDIDNKFIKENSTSLAAIAYDYFCRLEHKSPNKDTKSIEKSHRRAAKAINALHIFSERLLVPTGSAGFRISTKLHPFWNIYFNGLGVSIAEQHEPQRSNVAHSYRYIQQGAGLFDRDRSWRAYREATLSDQGLKDQNAVVGPDRYFKFL